MISSESIFSLEVLVLLTALYATQGVYAAEEPIHVEAFDLPRRAPLTRDFNEGYFRGVRPGDPLSFPGDSDEMLAKFPPSLLMTSGRDYSLSPMIHMHARLVHLGVKADRHVFEGFAHGGFLNMFIPESRHAAEVMSAFFDQHLGTANESK